MGRWPPPAQRVDDDPGYQAGKYNPADTQASIADLEHGQKQQQTSDDGGYCQPQPADRVLAAASMLS